MKLTPEMFVKCELHPENFEVEIATIRALVLLSQWRQKERKIFEASDRKLEGLKKVLQFLWRRTRVGIHKTSYANS